MAQSKQHLQRHRLAAFSATLLQLEERLQKQIEFVTDYTDVYKLPPAIARHNIRRYNKWLQSIRQLKDLQYKHI